VRRPAFDFDDRLPSQTINASSSYRHRIAQRQDRVRMAARPLLALGDNNDSTGGIWYTGEPEWRTVRSRPAFVNLNAPATGGRTI
jgi:hypothetical protein